MADTVNPPLTRERMRADLAQLLHMPPAELGEEDDLIDLGLDSMRLMTMVTRWADAGLRLDFAELAEKPTLGAWWALAASRLARPGHG
jgi:aryl carrier-like protein